LPDSGGEKELILFSLAAQVFVCTLQLSGHEKQAILFQLLVAATTLAVLVWLRHREF
jgi:hypothetical protein